MKEKLLPRLKRPFGFLTLMLSFLMLCQVSLADQNKIGSVQIGEQQGYVLPGETTSVSYEITIYRAPESSASGELNIGMCLKESGENVIFDHPGFSYSFDPQVPVMEWGNNKQYQVTTTLTLKVDASIFTSTDPLNFVVRAFYPATTNNGCTLTDGDFAETPIGDGVFQLGIPPSFTQCQNDTTVSNDVGQCDAVVNYNIAVDGNPTPTISYVFSGATTASGNGDGSGSTFSKGVTHVILTATNGLGDDATCEFNVTVNDDEAPSLLGTLPTDQTNLNLCYSSMPTGPTADEIKALYTDNCGVVNVDKSAQEADGNTDCGWSVTYTYDVYDDAGNHVSPSPSVTFSGSDQSAPNLIAGKSIPSGQTEMNQCEAPTGPTESEIAALFEDNCGGTVNVTKSGTPSGDKCGWSVTYTYEVKDECGNAVDPSPSIAYSGGDKTPPALKENASIPSGQTGMDQCEAPAGPTESEIAALYEDNCGGNISVVKSGEPSGDKCSWSVTYTYEVKDECGNAVDPSPSITYSGGDKTPPALKENASIPTGQTGMDQCEAPAGPTESEIAALYEDNCGGTVNVTKSGTPSGDKCEWSVTYTYEVKDECGNAVDPSPTITYSGGDKTPPNLNENTSIPSGQTEMNQCEAPDGPSESEIAALFEDNCGGEITVVKSGTPTGDKCDWSVTYTYEVKDECGNPVNPSPQVSYSGGDKTPPALKENASIPSGQTGMDQCEAPAGPTESEIAALYEDNCGGNIAVVKSGTPTGNQCSWSVTYSYEVKDECGNTVDPSPTITYSGGDKTPPEITSPVTCDGDTTVSTEPEACSYTAGTEFDATATDVCSGAVTPDWSIEDEDGTRTGTASIAGEVLKPGMSTITWTAEDACGNVATCSFDVWVKIPTATEVFTSADKARYCDEITLYAKISGQCDDYPLKGIVVFYLDGDSVGNAPAYPIPLGEAGYPDTLRATLIYKIKKLPKLTTPPGDDPNQVDPYQVTAVFIPDPDESPEYLGSESNPKDLLIYPRKAELFNAISGFYTADILAWTTGPESNTATITMAAILKDNETPSGDLRGAKVTFCLVDPDDGSLKPIPSAKHLPVGLIDMTNGTAGAASADVQINLDKATDTKTFQIAVIVSGGYYNDLGDDNAKATVTIAKPIDPGTVQTEGSLENTNSEGMIKGAATFTTDFNLDVSYNNKLTNPQGEMSITVQSYYKPDGTLDGQLHTYVINSNAINLFVMGPNSPEEGNLLSEEQAIFDAKANLSEMTSDGSMISIDGNSPLHISLTHSAEGDSIGITYYRAAGGVWFSSHWDWSAVGTPNGPVTLEQKFADGVITMGEQSNVNSNGLKSAKISATPVFETSSLNVYPNPFQDRLVFEFTSPFTTNARIEVYDVVGRLVKTVFDKPVEAGVNYRAKFKPISRMSNLYFYRMTLGADVFNGKVIYTK
ncbi:MAG TPA: hypothetical protein VKA27_06045 [Sunxiuqinia sp.]|nr:hypothetical protein [Sunxiuqinia sp.]